MGRRLGSREGSETAVRTFYRQHVRTVRERSRFSQLSPIIGPKTAPTIRKRMKSKRHQAWGALPRRREPELMDNPQIGRKAHEQALRGLSRLNRASLVGSALAAPIHRLARRRRLRPIRILDIASGAGDVARELHDQLRDAGLPAEVAGCDVSPTAVEHAAARSNVVRFFRLDALRDPIPPGFDVVTCSLFLHHLDQDNAVRLLRRMGQAARHMVLVSDLRRSRFNLALTYAATHLLSRSPVVRFDGPTSVRAAYTIEEALELAHSAGLNEATVRRHWAARYLLTWERPIDGN